jgi:hypothetical protein
MMAVGRAALAPLAPGTISTDDFAHATTSNTSASGSDVGGGLATLPTAPRDSRDRPRVHTDDERDVPPATTGVASPGSGSSPCQNRGLRPRGHGTPLARYRRRTWRGHESATHGEGQVA